MSPPDMSELMVTRVGSRRRVWGPRRWCAAVAVAAAGVAVPMGLATGSASAAPAAPAGAASLSTVRARVAVAAAAAQIGKPYRWAGAGPSSFDCSGLTRWAWAAAGVALPHLAQAQYALTRRVAIANLQPGDLVFYGTPRNVYHVGIYVGHGVMIAAPHTGSVVKYQSIYFQGLLGGGRVG